MLCDILKVIATSRRKTPIASIPTSVAISVFVKHLLSTERDVAPW